MASYYHYKLHCFIVSPLPPKYYSPLNSPNLGSTLFPQARCPNSSPLLSPRWPPAGAAEPGEDCSAGAGEGALAPGGPAGEGAAGKGEPAYFRPGNAARGGSRGKSKLKNSRCWHTRTEPRGSGDRAESCRKRDDAVHQPGTVTLIGCST